MKGLPDGAHAARQPFHLKSPRGLLSLPSKALTSVYTVCETPTTPARTTPHVQVPSNPPVAAMAMVPNRMDAARETSPTYPLGMYFLNAYTNAGTIRPTSPDANVVAVEISIWFFLHDENGLRHGAEGHGGVVSSGAAGRGKQGWGWRGCSIGRRATSRRLRRCR